MQVINTIKYKFILFSFLATLFITAIQQPVAHAQYGGGTGEPNNPYLIYTAEQMNSIGAEPNDWDKHFKLITNIDLAGYTGTDFNIIGYGFNAFTGYFDGNGYTISNFTYSAPEEGFAIGLFGYVDDPNAGISNLILIDPNVNAPTGIMVGTLVGWFSSGTINNCYAVNTSISGEEYIGGLIGRNSGLISDCNSTGSVSGSHPIGGLVGFNDRGGCITQSFASGLVTGEGSIGGLVGSNSNDAKITNCSSTANVIGNQVIGGLAGGNGGFIIDCHSDGNVEGQKSIGGLVGSNDGSIVTSYSSAVIQGQEKVGGLVGYNNTNGKIIDCYAIGVVSGQSYVGGLLGENNFFTGRSGLGYYGTINNCYSATTVSGNQQTGGLVGLDPGSGVSNNCFWDIETSGWISSDGGIGKTTAEMQDPNTYIEAGWDFPGIHGGPGDIWAEPEEGGYPILWWQLSPLPELTIFSGGTGTSNDPYLISTANELNSIGHNPRLMTAHFKLIDDIDLAGVDFFMIANQFHPFSGTFDGNWHVISNFSYTSSEVASAGLIGYAVGAHIKDLGLMSPNINMENGNFHGALVGLLESGTITNCYVESCNVFGKDHTGGLVGENNDGSIINSYSTGNVTGNDEVGGMTGTNSGTIINCYSKCSVEGNNIAGLVGNNNHNGKIIHCYCAGAVGGGSFVRRGLAGTRSSGIVIQSFWDTQITGQNLSEGGTGLTTAEMQTAGTFLDAGWDFIGETANGTQDIWWILEGQDYPRLWWEQMLK
jgi:hypothetical protein